MAMPRFSQTFTRACFFLLVLCDVCARLAMAQTVLVPEGACVGYENTLVRTCVVWVWTGMYVYVATLLPDTSGATSS